MPDPKAVQFANRFKFQLDRIFNGKDAEKDTARSRVPLIVKEANEAGISLPNPEQLGITNYDGELVAGLVEGGTFHDVATAEAPAPGATQTKSDKKKGAEMARKAKLAEAKAVKAEQKASKPKREKKVKEPHACLDGCGRMVTGRFAPGHDAKLKSLILKIERGEEDIASIPDVASALVKFKKGDIITEEGKDEKGAKMVTKTQTYICTESPVKLPGHTPAAAAA